ncbi:MAG: hypothetical protein LBO02_01935 [Holosporaceae bacterium]|jgi:hypothetical protein|nr:hypothetical protein [Holosporaceae bacterium]
MHKIKASVLIFFTVLLSVLCAVKIAEFQEVEDQRNRLIASRNHIDELAKQIKKYSFSYLKSKELIFTPNPNLVKSIEKISKSLKKVLIKRNPAENTEEIKIFTQRESEIYEFIEKLLFELPGVVQFQSIRLFQSDDENFSAVVRFKVVTFDERLHLIFLNPTVRSRDLKSINFFGIGEVKLHKLFCTICNSKAYIDNLWFRIGDRIDDCELAGVHQNFIEIKDDVGAITRIKLGACW